MLRNLRIRKDGRQKTEDGRQEYETGGGQDVQ
jgi:hypothetical protein